MEVDTYVRACDRCGSGSGPRAEARRRCVYDKQAKPELVRRCQQPSVSVAALALAHGLNANLLIGASDAGAVVDAA